MYRKLLLMYRKLLLMYRKLLLMYRKLLPAQSKTITGILGGMLLAIGIVWLGWLLFFQHSDSGVQAVLTFSAQALAPTATVQGPPLQAVGITLSHTEQKAALSQQQALVLASQNEPDAATHAKSVVASYMLLNCPATSGSTAHPAFKNVAVWVVWYRQIPQQATTQSHYDLYVFLNANTGNELLSVRT